MDCFFELDLYLIFFRATSSFVVTPESFPPSGVVGPLSAARAVGAPTVAGDCHEGSQAACQLLGGRSFHCSCPAFFSRAYLFSPLVFFPIPFFFVSS